MKEATIGPNHSVDLFDELYCCFALLTNGNALS